MEISVIITVIMLAIVVQFVVDIIKGIIPILEIGTFKLSPVYALIVGIILAIVYNVNIMAGLGFVGNAEIVGQIVTGLVVSGGSSFVHELFSKLRESRDNSGW